MLRVVQDETIQEAPGGTATLDELLRQGAQRVLAAALEAEVEQYVESHRGARDEGGHALVVRNGSARARQLVSGTGVLTIRAPRVNDQRCDEKGRRQRFTSKILPPYMRRSPKVAEVLPVLYLRGLSTGDFQEALPVLLGEEARGLSPTTITRLTATWQADYDAFRKRDLSDRDYVYVWADGVHFNIRLDDERLCTLVLVGARPDGTKEVIAVEDGFRESKESWLTLLRDLKSRGMRAPVVAVGDGALGFWAAVREVWPETREQRCWLHKMVNVMDKLPKSLQGKAKDALREMMYAENRAECETVMDKFIGEHQAKYEKATKCLETEREKLLTHFDFPAEHWLHLRTTNVIESPFATVRLRERVTKGAGSRSKGLLMAYKLLDMAQGRWRRLNGSELLPQVRLGDRFVDGVRQERAEHVKQSTQVKTKKVRRPAA
jgi:transposase-like protein